jgi:phosphatidylserine/phosphatidylglycerophosphate/cardiolipin synthase-like enzyme
LKTEILGTGPEIIKNGTRGVEPVIEEIIKNARKEIQIAAYVLTSRALHLIELLVDAAKRGVKITLILNARTCRDKEISLKLDYLVESFPHVRVINFRSLKKQLHAKVIVVDRNTAIIGSANFSWGGMYSNYEIGVLVEGNQAWEVAKILDQLCLIN